MSTIKTRTSVVMGTFNGGKYLKKQLDSLLQQTVIPHEIIIADDGSTDNTFDILQQFLLTTSISVIIYKNEHNLGYSENFLKASLKSTGDYVAFCDQDDIWHPQKIEVCQKILSSSNIILVVHSAELINSLDIPVGAFSQGIAHHSIKPPLSYGPWHVFFGFSMVFKRILLNIINPAQRGIDYILPGRQLSHDRWILLLANMIGQTNEIAAHLAQYRQHDANTFGFRSGRVYKNRLDITKESFHYLQSAYEIRKIIDIIALSPSINDTEFDYLRSVEFWDTAIEQQRLRNILYCSGSFQMELISLLRNLFLGTYRTLPQKKFRFRSFLKDLKFITDSLSFKHIK